MPHVTIDSSVLALPDGCRADGIGEYVERILDWKQLLDERWVGVHMSARTPEILFGSGCYSYQSLKSIFSRAGIEQYDARTVNRVVMALLQVTPSFEEFFGVRDVLTSEVETAPDVMSAVKPPVIAVELARLIVLAALVNQCDENMRNGHAIVIGSHTGTNVISVKAMIYELEHSRSDLNDFARAPEMFEGSIWACGNFVSFVEKTDERELWRSSGCPVDLHAAIRVALLKSGTRRGVRRSWVNLPRFRIGKHFYQTAMQCCSGRPQGYCDKVLRAVVETVDKLEMADTHALRVDRGASSAQVVRRGTDKAWRRDIDHEFHLHYWDCADGQVELANVVAHNDFEITA